MPMRVRRLAGRVSHFDRSDSPVAQIEIGQIVRENRRRCGTSRLLREGRLRGKQSEERSSIQAFFFAAFFFVGAFAAISA